MRERATVSFIVEIKDGRFLGADMDVVDEEHAVRFQLYRSPTVREQLVIDQIKHDVAGGLERFIDLQSGVQRTRRRLYDEAVKLAYPGGLPSTADDNARKLVEANIESAFLTLPASSRDGLDEMVAMLDRINLVARWRTLFASADVAGRPVGGWSDIESMELPIGHFDALWVAERSARLEAEQRTGKPQPSAS